ncbi:MAG: hypothetical protein ACOYOK_12080 [Pseudobdellovibrionaceae bacterium]
MKNIFILCSLIFFSACASSRFDSSEKIAEIVRKNTQCIVDYKVVYFMNDVPEWDASGENFCKGPEQKSIPLSISTYPLNYTQNKKGTLQHKETWFYVVWGCYSTCDKLKKE